VKRNNRKNVSPLLKKINSRNFECIVENQLIELQNQSIKIHS